MQLDHMAAGTQNIFDGYNCHAYKMTTVEITDGTSCKDVSGNCNQFDLLAVS